MNFNLLPWRTYKAKTKKNYFYFFTLFSFLSFLILNSLWHRNIIKTHHLVSNKNAIMLKKLNRLLFISKNLPTDPFTYQQANFFIKQLEQLMACLPAQVYFSKWSGLNGRWEIEAHTDQMRLIILFITCLTCKKFKSIQLLRLENNPDFKFRIKINTRLHG